MISEKIALKNPNEVIEFVQLVEQFPYSVIMSVDQYIINAKSILGMLVLGANHVMKMDIYADNADDLLKSINKFIPSVRL